MAITQARITKIIKFLGIPSGILVIILFLIITSNVFVNSFMNVGNGLLTNLGEVTLKGRILQAVILGVLVMVFLIIINFLLS